MDVEKLAQYDDGKGLTFVEAIRQANEKNARILSNKEITARLVETNQWESEKEVYPCRTGTLAVYETKGTPFGPIVEWEGFKVKVPKKWQGKRDMVILCNHPDFKLADDGTITLGKSAKIRDMPEDDGWYDADSEFDFPTGEEKSYESSRRYLYRRDKFVGLVSRGDFFFIHRVVVCGDGPSTRFGVLCVSKGKRTLKPTKPDDAMIWLKKTAKTNKNARKILKRLREAEI